MSPYVRVFEGGCDVGQHGTIVRCATPGAAACHHGGSDEDGSLALITPHEVCEDVDHSTAIALAAENAEGGFGRGKRQRVPNMQNEKFWHNYTSK
jgi:hypothetical protein